MAYRLYVGSCACDVIHRDAEKYAYGLSAYEFTEDFSKVRPILIHQQCLNPAFLTVTEKNLYAGNEFTDCAYLSAYSLDPGDGSLRFINKMDIPGTGLCEITYANNKVFGAEFWSGNVASFSLDENGGIEKNVSYLQHVGSSVHPVRQTCAHVHSVYADRSGKYLIACDLGMDQIVIYHINEDGSLSTNEACPFVKIEAGHGPRHFVFHPSNKYGYLITEMTDTVISYSFDESTGTLTQLAMTPGLPEGYTDFSIAADIRITDDGRYLYTTHRRSDFIAVYEIDASSGVPAKIAQFDSFGQGPRCIDISPDGKYMAIANREEHLVVVCQLDAETGLLGEKVWENIVMEPCCVAWYR